MLVPAFCHTHPFRTKEHRLMVIGGPGGDGGYVVAMSWNSPRFGVGIQASQSLSLTFSFSFSLCISMYPVFTSKKIYTRRIACLLSNFRSQSSDNMDKWPGVGVGAYPWNSLESQARRSKPPEGDPKICQPSDSFRCYPPSYNVFDDRTVWYDKPRAQQYTKHHITDRIYVANH